MDAFFYLSTSENPSTYFHLQKEMSNLQRISSMLEISDLNLDYEKNPLIVFVDIQGSEIPLSNLLSTENFAYFIIIDNQYTNAQACLRLAREYNIRDYLAAPFSSAEIQDCLDRYYHCLALRKIADKNNLVIKEKGAHIYIETRSIKLLEGFGSYTRIHTADKVYIVSKTIKKILELLPNQFIRTHRSFAVHQKQLRSLIGNTLILHNGDQVKVSKSGRQIVLDHFNKAS